ncbi:hypothetical protein BHM03_00043971 [Ensete ventricosum]|nr:hypothetical protein BHM03_00043971 [Ensete ventricosum]
MLVDRGGICGRLVKAGYATRDGGRGWHDNVPSYPELLARETNDRASGCDANVFRTTEWELADSSLEVGRGLGDIVGSSPRAHQRFVGKFVDGSPICCRELTRNSPEGCWEFVEGNQELIGRMPGVRREIS